MNWMPIKHTLFVNRTKAGTFSLQLRPSNHGEKNRFSATASGSTFEEAVGQIEKQVKAVRIIKEGT